MTMPASGYGKTDKGRYDVVLVDTSILMAHTCDFEPLIHALQIENMSMIIPSIVEREIEKHLCSNNSDKRTRAEGADEIRKLCINRGVAKIRDISNGMLDLENDIFADPHIVGYIEYRRLKHDFLVLTADRKLAKRLLLIKESEHIRTSRLLDIAALDCQGKLDYWQSAICAVCRKSTAVRQSALLKYSKALCENCIEARRQNTKSTLVSDILVPAFTGLEDDLIQTSQVDSQGVKNSPVNPISVLKVVIVKRAQGSSDYIAENQSTPRVTQIMSKKTTLNSRDSGYQCFSALAGVIVMAGVIGTLAIGLRRS